MLAFRQAQRGALLTAAVLAFAVTAPGVAFAQVRLEARYAMTLAGLPIGRGSWVIDINQSQYWAVATGTTTGLMHTFTGGEGITNVRGIVQGGRMLASTYTATITTRKKTDAVRLNFANGNVKDVRIDPPQDKDAERVPVTEADRQGVLDPMTATMLRAPGNSSPLSPDACQRTVAVFDGKLRYDLKLAFKRMDEVKADKGYAGPVLVCAVYFSPVAGYIPTRAAIKYLSRQRNIEIWLAPIAGTRVLVPFRVQGPTPIGEAVLEATQFVAVATPVKASVNGPKTQ